MVSSMLHADWTLPLLMSLLYAGWSELDPSQDLGAALFSFWIAEPDCNPATLE